MLLSLFKFAAENNCTIQNAAEVLGASAEDLMDALRLRLDVGYNPKTHEYMRDYKANIRACIERLENAN